MVKVELKGLHRVPSNGKIYFYAWRGGPRLKGEEGSPEFIASFNEAIASLSSTDDSKFRSVIRSYRASASWKKLSDSTKRNWVRCLDEIEDYFGDLRIIQFDRSEKIRPIIRRWRNKWAEKPRTADYHMQVLSRVCAHAVDPLGLINSNPCEGIKQLYSTDRSEIIWTEDDIARLKRGNKNKSEILFAVDLAAYTGLRLGDLVRVSWSHIGDYSIVIPTGKSRGVREAIVPLYDELRELLTVIPKRSTTILTNSLGKPWRSEDSFGSAFNRAKLAAGLEDRDLHFHDLRGTAATRFYAAGLEMRAIAEIMGWGEDQVAKIIRRYVNKYAATKALIEQMNRRAADRKLIAETPNVIPIKLGVFDHPVRGVYFLQNADLVKIGWSESIPHRMRGLQTGSGKELKLLHVVAGEKADETRFHREFSAHRVRGEWFKIEGPLEQFLAPYLPASENEG